MKCRAWETRHQNGKTYIHIVNESLEPEHIKDIAERVAGSPLTKTSKFPVHRDIAGSYLVAEIGNESIGFVPEDSHITEDIAAVREALEGLVKGHQVEAQALLSIMERLGMKGG